MKMKMNILMIRSYNLCDKFEPRTIRGKNLARGIVRCGHQIPFYFTDGEE